MELKKVSWRIATFVVVFVSFLEVRAASVIETVGDPAFQLSANGITVPVYREIMVHIEPGSAPRRVFLTGAGIRVKKVFLFQEKAYVAASYIDREGGFPSGDPVAAIGASRIEVVRITTLRDLSAEQIRSSIEDSLDANGIDLEKPELSRVLSQMRHDLPAGATETIVGLTLSDDKERVYIEYPKAIIDESGPELALDIWRCWFGVPTDEGLAALKAKLLGKG